MVKLSAGPVTLFFHFKHAMYVVTFMLAIKYEEFVWLPELFICIFFLTYFPTLVVHS